MDRFACSAGAATHSVAQRRKPLATLAAQLTAIFELETCLVQHYPLSPVIADGLRQHSWLPQLVVEIRKHRLDEGKQLVISRIGGHEEDLLRRQRFNLRVHFLQLALRPLDHRFEVPR